MDPLTVARAAERVGTPFYLYDAEVLRANGRALLSAFGRFRPHYSLKANPCPGLCALVSSMGFGAEVSSRFEAEIALRAGFDPAEMLYDGPAKTVDEIGHGLLAGIRRFNVESPAELGRIRRTLAETGVREPLHLCARVNPERSTSAGEVMTGGSSRFGMDEETLEPLLQRSRADGSTPSGIHLYIGSQILDPAEISRSFDLGLEILGRLRTAGLLDPDRAPEIVFGPGIGMPYSPGERPVDLESLSARMTDSLDRTEGTLPGIEARLEIGRALIASCGAYVFRVMESKVSRGVRYILVDGGIHHFMRYAMTGTRHRVVPVGREWDRVSTAFVTGATCTPHDVLSECPVGDVEEGDLLALLDAGAYGWSMGLSGFLSRPTPPEVLADDGRLTVLRRRSTFDDLSALCAIP